MKVVANACFGGFCIPDEFCKKYNIDDLDAKYGSPDVQKAIRSDERLVNYVIANADIFKSGSTQLRVYEIPDEVTDWEVTDYDGVETITYVLEGKLHHAGAGAWDDWDDEDDEDE